MGKEKRRWCCVWQEKVILGTFSKGSLFYLFKRWVKLRLFLLVFRPFVRSFVSSLTFVSSSVRPSVRRPLVRSFVRSFACSRSRPLLRSFAIGLGNFVQLLDRSVNGLVRKLASVDQSISLKCSSKLLGSHLFNIFFFDFQMTSGLYRSLCRSIQTLHL